MKVATDFTFTQMSENASFKKFGEEAMLAMVKEYRQIDKGPTEGKPVITPIDHGTLSYKYKRKAL